LEECVTRDQVPVLVMPDSIQDMAQQRQRQVTKPVVRVLAQGKTSTLSVIDAFLEKHGTVPKPLCTISDDVCSACNTGHLVLDVVTDMLVCEHCRNEQECTQASDRSAGYGGAQAPHYSACRYNRISHYSTHLDRVSGCVGSDKITPKLLVRVMQRLKDNGVVHVNVGHVERALKDLDLNKLCSHKVVITARITGLPPPAFSPPERCMLLEMFIHINAAFIKLRRANQLEGRLNYLSYPYTIYKCVEMLTWGQKYMLYFNLLRCEDNLAKQDRCWEKICAEVGLPFIRSTHAKPK
jgi:RNA-binding protein YhbY